jgi:glucosamine--fructose-6-phosphate aminotransferase (isomerizing)
MCGIFGHYTYNTDLTRQEIIDLLLQGLRRLEYRGYDSAGLSIESTPHVRSTSGEICRGPSPVLIKQKGNIAALAELAASELTRPHLDPSLQFRSHVGTLWSRNQILTI